jgi:hypothetical protein
MLHTSELNAVGSIMFDQSIYYINILKKQNNLDVMMQHL